MSKVEFECPDCGKTSEVFYIDVRGGRILCDCKDIEVDHKVILNLIKHLLYEVEDLKDEIKDLKE